MRIVTVLLMCVSAFGQLSPHRRVVAGGGGGGGGCGAGYVSSDQTPVTTSGPSGVNNYFFNATVSHTYTAGNFLIVSQLSDASASLMSINTITDNGGNTYSKITNTNWTSNGNADTFIMTAGFNPATTLTVNFHVNASFSAIFTINGTVITGEYSAFTYNSSLVSGTSSATQEVHINSASGHCLIGVILESNNAGANTFSGPDVGGVVRQTFHTDGVLLPGQAHTYFAEFCLIDSLSSPNAVSQTLTNAQPPTNALFSAGAASFP